MNKQPCVPQLGADCEGFLVQPSGNVIPCVGIVPGTKEKPHQLPDYPKGYMTQEDNVMVEVNIPPQKTGKGFYTAIKKIKQGVCSVLPRDHSVFWKDGHTFKPSQLTSQQAVTIGCDPDFDAYQGGRLRSALPTLTNFRGAGSHLHFGGDFQCPDFVAALFCDLVLGIGTGLSTGRRTPRADWYGKPGIYRPKPYGIEWRSPGSSWMGNQDLSMEIGTRGMRLATWLTETDSAVLQEVFNAQNWAEIYDYLDYNPRINDRHKMHMSIMNNAVKTGVPMT